MMRSTRPTDPYVLRGEVAKRLGLGNPSCPQLFEESCRSYLEQLRWPEGIECPRCFERSRLLWLEGREKWHCYACRYQFSVTAGTVFHHTRLPVWKWFVAVELMLRSPEGLSANQLWRTIGGSYKTAWFAAHRIRAAIRGHSEPLSSLGRAGARSTAPPLALDSAQRRVGAKYRSGYVGERRWRSRHSGNPYALRDTISALLQHEGISYDRLTAPA